MHRILLFLFPIALFAADEAKKPVIQNDPFVLAPDGSIAVIPYNPRQLESVNKISQEIDFYHSQINEKIKFLSFEKRMKDSRYGQVGYARAIQLPYESPYVQHSRYVMKLKGGGGAEGGGFSLDEISFWSRKSLTQHHKEPITIYREMKNSASNGGAKSLTISVRTVTIYDDTSNTYELEKIQSPWDRLKLMRTYRDRLIEVLRSIDRYIMTKGTLQAREVDATILEVTVGGDFQEP